MSWFRFFIIIDIEVGTNVHGKYFVDNLNAKEKGVIKLEMSNLLNREIIFDHPKFSSS